MSAEPVGAGSEDLGSRELVRFTRAQRWAHQVAGGLVLVCIATAAVLYLGPLAVLVGNRRTVTLVHVVSGFAIPVPLLLALPARAYRSDLGRLGRLVEQDWAWLRSAQRRRSSVGVGKFNAGQKLNSSLSAGSILVLLGSGTLMQFTGIAPLAQRVGATFVHDWFALAFGLLVVGHVVKAVGDPEALRGIRSGRVLRVWARHEHPEWEREQRRPPPPQG